MEMSVLWSAGLSAAAGLCAWWIKSQAEELRRVQILINKTREELARDYVTKQDNNAAITQIVARFDRIEEKIDRLVERK